MKKGSIVKTLTVLFVFAFVISAGSWMAGLGISQNKVFAAQTGNPTITGVKDFTIGQGEYINLYDGITAKDSLGTDITQSLLVAGNFDFSKAGTYDLTYSVIDNEGNKATAPRKITVIAGASGNTAPPAVDRNLKEGVNPLGKSGSFAAGNMSITRPRGIVNLATNLKNKPVPSTDWWTSLIIKDFGDQLVCNPLLVRYSANGLAIGNPGGTNNPGNRVDMNLGFKGFSGAKLTVVDHSDFGIAVNLSNDATCKVLTYLNQGSPYVFAKYAGGATPVVSPGNNNLVGYFDGEFKAILASSGVKYTGDHIIMETRNPTNYYVVNAPQGTEFTRGSNNAVDLALPAGSDYVSIGSALSKEMATVMHEHGYAFVVSTHCSYDVMDDTNEVITDYYHRIWQADATHSPNTVMMLRPHQHMRSYNEFLPEGMRTVRGPAKLMVGNSFRTIDQFNGILPSFAEPTNPEYSKDQLKKYVAEIDSIGGSAGADAYWDGKTSQILAQGAMMADQVGDTALRDKLVGKLKSRLPNWLTADPDEISSSSNRPFFYYDASWGVLLQKSNAYGFNNNLADHHFHLGYLVYACAVLAYFDQEFLNDYREMVELMIRDYASPYRDDPLFCYMRSFDIFAGHSWASGYNDNVSGGNQESSSESLNAYAGMYLWGQVSGNEVIKKAGAYIFTTELSAIKEYWFNYSGTSFPESYNHGSAGMIWGTSIAYGTWFSGAAHCIYGIQWIPSGEYLTSHVLSAQEQQCFKVVYDYFLKDSNNRYDWKDCAYPMHSLVDPDEVMKLWGNGSTLNSMGGKCDGNTGARVYMFVNTMKDLNRRTSLIWAKNANSVSFYEKKDGKVVAQVWNPSAQSVEITFANYAGATQKYTAAPKSLTRVDVTIASVDPPARPPGWSSSIGGGVGGNNPGTPSTPGTPGNPGNPSNPDNPGNPGNPGNPDNPGTGEEDPPAVPGAPSAPLRFVATPSGGQVVLTWRTPANSGDFDITGYKVAIEGGNWVDVPVGEQTFTYTGLTNGTKYNFKVRAVNARGLGEIATVSAKPSDRKGCGCGTIGFNDIMGGITLTLGVLLAASLPRSLRQKRRLTAGQ
ncbi:MAG: glycosyl hydrolase [Firmicutes bacterium]|nr:glycosyl hydrolase [Bacillota bacterium]